jgi:hypothetical protein
MARCRGSGLRWVLCAAVTGCAAVDEAELATIASESSDEGAPSSSSTSAADESSSDVGSDTSTESEGGDEESSTTAALVGALVEVAPGKTTDAELVKTLAIARTEQDAERRVVLELDPWQLPELGAGDHLIAAAEVQVTTRCDVGQTAPGCDYDPQIAAQLVLRSDSDESDVAMSEVKTQTCTRTEHHCMFVFRPSDADVVLEGALAACTESAACRVSLVMWAWDDQARAGDVDEVLVGENEGDYLVNGIIGSDKARIMAVRERGELGDDVDESEITGDGSLQVPTDATATLVYSHRLTADSLRVGEQFLLEAKVVTNVSSRARVSSLMFVTDDPAATEPEKLDAITPQQIGEHNGINCTAGESPCTTRKVGVFRVIEDVGAPLFVNIVVKSAVPGGGTADVEVQRDAGWLRATRYAADLHG